MRQRRHATQGYRVPPTCPPCPTCFSTSTMFTISNMLRWFRQNLKKNLGWQNPKWQQKGLKRHSGIPNPESGFCLLVFCALGFCLHTLCSACVPFNCTEHSYCCWIKMLKYLDIWNWIIEISLIFLMLTIQIDERTDPKQLFCITKTIGVMSVKGAALLNLDHWLLISETP